MVQERRSLRLGALGALALVLAGCPVPERRPSPPSLPSSGAPRPVLPPAAQPPPGQPAPVAPPPPPPVHRENHLSPATRSLVTQAHAQMSRGDLDGASATLDRALRIEANNPLLWTERGRLRLAENDARQAENCARKALALASGDRAAQGQAGRLLADALRAEGRNQEAHDVESRPFMH